MDFPLNNDKNKLAEERASCGCNQRDCNYQFHPIDMIDTKIEEGIVAKTITKAVMFCTFCSHTEECIFSPEGMTTKQLIEQ